MSKSRWYDILCSVLAAALGVQSEHNRKRDFAGSSVWPYVLVGILFLVVFCAVLLTVATLAIPSE